MDAPMAEVDALVLTLGVIRATRLAQLKPVVVKPAIKRGRPRKAKIATAPEAVTE
mgnify:FL=1